MKIVKTYNTKEKKWVWKFQGNNGYSIKLSEVEGWRFGQHDIWSIDVDLLEKRTLEIEKAFEAANKAANEAIQKGIADGFLWECPYCGCINEVSRGYNCGGCGGN